MASSDPNTPPTSDARSFDGISHGYAPDGRPLAPPPVPLEKIVGDVVDNLSATAKAELALLEARTELALHGASWTAGWGAVAASALGIAMLALAFGAILALAPHVGPFIATLIVVAILLAVAAFAGWRAQRSYGDIRTALRRDLTNEGIDDAADA
ncbi:Putative Holin-X, holin superfamily III [Sphingopyxis sp. YR583]|uniref:phage holin family protein n=1 Tax=Sphingopyxis sp. YR583 TaxID=1881047 RepID=UPI0008A7F587|nr:phage holin family protein [Sphingopyxis sp. YR583]SEH20155.1 Putative Holin-X, holin superfamily III [Sphingopyxis sp. YR583]